LKDTKPEIKEENKKMNGAASKFKCLEDIRGMNYVTKNSSSFVAFFFTKEGFPSAPWGSNFLRISPG
jgi:hypothetical protein